MLHWKRGRRTVIVPGAQIRRVEVSGKSLTEGILLGLPAVRWGKEVLLLPF